MSLEGPLRRHGIGRRGSQRQRPAVCEQSSNYGASREGVKGVEEKKWCQEVAGVAQSQMPSLDQ